MKYGTLGRTILSKKTEKKKEKTYDDVNIYREG